MSYRLFHTLLACVLSATLYGQANSLRLSVMPPVRNPMMPLIIMEHFHRSSPDATRYFSIEGRFYTVRYIDPGTQLGHIITYDKNGMVIKIENEVEMDEWPASLREYYLKVYPSPSTAVWWREDNQGNTGYYFVYKSKMILFDPEGRYVGRRNFN
jgi:hypothetical protein